MTRHIATSLFSPCEARLFGHSIHFRRFQEGIFLYAHQVEGKLMLNQGNITILLNEKWDNLENGHGEALRTKTTKEIHMLRCLH